MEIITKSEKETHEFAKDFAQSLNFGDVLALEGELGSGKTAFAKGVAAALGISDYVTSPTYLIVKEYKFTKFQNSNIPTLLKELRGAGKLQINFNQQTPGQVHKLVHIDCYRIKSIEDAESVGISDYLESEGNVTVIEWAENIASILPKKTKRIKFEHLGTNIRKITVV